MASKVIYIIGAGRSGTTLLDIILGNADDVFSAGELNRYTERDGIPTEVNSAAAGNFWKEIRNTLAEKGILSPIKYYPLSKKYEHHFAVHRLFFNTKKKSFKAYLNYQHIFFSILSKKVSAEYNKNIIIDSSKYPLRAYFLSMVLQKNIAYIYVKRNPLAVAESFQKKDIEQGYKNRLTANLYLVTINSLARIILKRLRKKHSVVSIFYEDLLTNPQAVLEKIETTLNISLQKTKELIVQDSPLQVGYLFDGNRLRLKKEIKLKTKYNAYKAKKITDKFFYFIHRKFWYE